MKKKLAFHSKLAIAHFVLIYPYQAIAAYGQGYQASVCFLILGFGAAIAFNIHLLGERRSVNLTIRGLERDVNYYRKQNDVLWDDLRAARNKANDQVVS